MKLRSERLRDFAPEVLTPGATIRVDSAKELALVETKREVVLRGGGTGLEDES